MVVEIRLYSCPFWIYCLPARLGSPGRHMSLGSIMLCGSGRRALSSSKKCQELGKQKRKQKRYSL